MKKIQRVTLRYALTIASAIVIISCTPILTNSIDFEDIPQGTVIRAEYGSRGVVFPSSGYIDVDAHTHSGSQVLRAANPAVEFHSGPLVIQFSAPQRRVKLYAGTTGYDQPTSGILRAFDTNGTLVGEDGPKNVLPNALSTSFEISVAETTIVKLELEIGIVMIEVIDDLEFEGRVVSGTDIASPIVAITSPINGEVVDTNNIEISGTISGENILPTARLLIEYRDPRPSHTRILIAYITLSGSGSLRTFALSYGTLPIGPIVVTIEAENTYGRTGSSSVNIDNMPSLILERYSDVSADVLGSFNYGLRKQDCIIAVYDHGAISQSGTITHLIVGEIFDKWMLLHPVLGMPTTSDEPGEIGCPLSEAAETSEFSMQDFDYGKIVVSSTRGAAYIPHVFVEAIDAVGGMQTVGLPLMDPAQEIHPAYDTRLFQRFSPLGGSGSTTIELRRTPSKLYVERRSSPMSPTIVDVFGCISNSWICTFTVPAKQPLTDMGNYCNYETYNWWEVKNALLGGIGISSPPEPAQWEPIVGDQVQTPLVGIVTGSEMTAGDDPFSHEHEWNCPPSMGDLLAWSLDEITEGDGEPSFCESDWTLDVVPLPAWRDKLGEGRDSVHIEYEKYYSRVMELFAGSQPRIGDLSFISGRWIVDCGHSYKTEIHPPGILATMRSSYYQTNSATLANVWITGWFTGGTVEFYIDPPPRPSSRADLQTVEERHSMIGVNVTVLPAQSRLLVRVTSPVREVPVTDMNEMKWQTGMGGETRFYVFWVEGE